MRRRWVPALAVLTASLIACVSFAMYDVADRGLWPDSWPKPLDRLRPQARTLAHGQHTVYEIPFTQRAEFESAWPHILTVVSAQAPLVLLRSPDKWLGDSIAAGVRIRCPPTGQLVTFQGANYPPGSESAIADGKFLKVGPPWPDDIKSPSGALPEYVIIDNGKWRAFDKKDFGGPNERTIRRARIEMELIVDGDVVDLNRIPLPADTPIIDKRFRGGDNKAAAGDDKPTSNDLGKIQPPGGVPLRVVGPEGAYTVDGLNKARRRLEAVPEGDLEKWVVELERIMDKKLKDGVPSARQACRTDFAIHMSVAFDDLKWNAKTADGLFQRAQTMPATEAKVWKEAFESLLKKKIGQTDTEIYDGGPAWAVPLVLIPVDALHEGQKYSAERAKKYLARMKQLTAEDVSLWKDKVDEFGGTRLDAAVNIILLDDWFDKENFQRDKFRAAVGARKK